MAVANRQTVFNYLILASLALLLFRAVSLYERGLGPVFGWNARLLEDQIVTYVDAKSPAAQAGLKTGDRIIAFDELQGFDDDDQRKRLTAAYRTFRVGASYRMTVQRDGNELEIEIPSAYKGQPDTRWNILQYHAVGLIYLLFGLAILLLKPYDPQAMIFSSFMMSLSACYLPVISSRLPPGIGAVVDIIQYGFVFATPFFFTHFALVFPQRLLPERLCSRLLAALYAVMGAQAICYLIAKLVDLHAPLVYNRTPFMQWLAVTAFNSFYVAFIAGVLVAFASLLSHLRLSDNIQHKRKVRVVLTGMLFGLPPIIILNGIARFLGITVIPAAAWIVGLLSLIFPLAFAYAIIKHRVMDVRLILRRSVRYILISRLLPAIETVFTVIVLYYVVAPRVEIITGKIGTNTLIISAAAGYGLISLLIGFTNRRLMRAVDRIFFRDVYSTEKILTELAQAISVINEQSELLKTVAGELMRALHVERVAFFLPDDKRWSSNQPAGSKGRGPAPPGASCWIAVRENGEMALRFEAELQPAASLMARSDYGHKPVDIDIEDEGSLYHQLSDGEQRLLAGAQTSILIPLKEGEKLVGLMSLSAKLSDLPYTSEDKQLLETVSAQISIALQRVWLLRQVTQQERLRREMEIASMVQRKLFPQAVADTPTLEIVGVCHPARSVGGDYYDFINIAPGRLGIAIGDVSGKGISAALIMSTLQASLRSMAPVEQYEVVDIVNIVNRLLFRSTDADKFATFFYGVYDEESRLLTYVNAGHDPPFILHHISGSDAEGSSPSNIEIVRPDQGGMVLGVLDGYAYEQETILLASGDTLIGYTDGLTEAVNSAGEMFGEDRIKELVGGNAHLSARALHQLIIDNIRQYIGDMEQRDDLTVIVAKVR